MEDWKDRPQTHLFKNIYPFKIILKSSLTENTGVFLPIQNTDWLHPISASLGLGSKRVSNNLEWIIWPSFDLSFTCLLKKVEQAPCLCVALDHFIITFDYFDSANNSLNRLNYSYSFSAINCPKYFEVRTVNYRHTGKNVTHTHSFWVI